MAKPWSKIVSRFALALALVFVITATAIGAVLRFAERAVARIPRTVVTVDATHDGAPVNYLIIGSDSRAKVKSAIDEEHFGSASSEAGQRSDTIMIAHVNPATHEAMLVSIPRDLWVDVPGRGKAKINAAYNDGPQTVIDTVRGNLDVPINHYLEVDFFGFQKLVDTIGAVHVFFPTIAQDTYTGLFVATPGCVALGGKQALAYVRSRHYQYKTPDDTDWHDDPTGDLGRISRQQYFLRTLVPEAIDAGTRNVFKVNRLVDDTVRSLTVDRGFGFKDFQALAGAFQDVGSEVEMQTLPTSPGTSADGQSILNLTASEAGSMLAALRNDVASEPALPRIAHASIRVRVLNGSGVDNAARDALDALSGQGFAGNGIGNARTALDKTEVEYRPGQRDKARVVLASLGGVGSLIESRSASGSSDAADVVVVLGRDFRHVVTPTTASGRGGGSATSTTRPPNPGSTPGVDEPVTVRGRPLVGCGS